MQQKAQEDLGSQSSSNSRSGVTVSHRPLTAVQRDRTGTTAVQLRSGRPASAAPAFVRRENVAVVKQVEDEGGQEEEEGDAAVVQHASSALSLFDRSEGGASGAEQVPAAARSAVLQRLGYSKASFFAACLTLCLPLVAGLSSRIVVVRCCTVSFCNAIIGRPHETRAPLVGPVASHCTVGSALSSLMCSIECAAENAIIRPSNFHNFNVLLFLFSPSRRRRRVKRSVICRAGGDFSSSAEHTVLPRGLRP